MGGKWWFLYGLMLLLVYLAFEATGSSSMNMMCEVTGTCVHCRAEEMDKDYCRDSGKRIRIRCKDGPNEFDDYKSCEKTAEDEQLRVIIFQATIGVVGGLAYWGVQTRKKFSMSLFDSRKQRRQI